MVHLEARNHFRLEVPNHFRWAVDCRCLNRFRTGFRNQIGFRIDCRTGSHLQTQSLARSLRLRSIDNRYRFRCNSGDRFPRYFAIRFQMRLRCPKCSLIGFPIRSRIHFVNHWPKYWSTLIQNHFRIHCQNRWTRYR